MNRTLLDDGFHSYLIKGATFSGAAGIPNLLDLKNAHVPKRLISFQKCLSTRHKDAYVHFYSFDQTFRRLLVNAPKYVEVLRSFEGVITPDPSITIGQSKCLQETNVYFNRAVGLYLQMHGVPVIPNVRWGDETTFSFCFLGVPKHSIVSVGTHGCMKDRELRRAFKIGLEVMLERLEPTDVIVYGAMPDDVFGPYKDMTRFHRFPSEFELSHGKEDAEDGNE